MGTCSRTYHESFAAGNFHANILHQYDDISVLNFRAHLCFLRLECNINNNRIITCKVSYGLFLHIDVHVVHVMYDKSTSHL